MALEFWCCRCLFRSTYSSCAAVSVLASLLHSQFSLLYLFFFYSRMVVFVAPIVASTALITVVGMELGIELDFGSASGIFGPG